jgi:hypothetical protein
MGLFKRTKTTSQTLDLRAITPAVKKPRRHRPRKRLIIGFAAGALLLLVAAFGAWQLYAVRANHARSDMQRAVIRVGRLMILPTGETPSFGTVTDATKLKKETFFAYSQTGDQVLIYQKAKLSILYRPSINKIVNVGPLIVGTQSSPYITSRIAILNGAGADDRLAAMAQAVTTAFPNAPITSKAAASRTYPTTIVIDLTALHEPLTEQMADILGVQPGKAPIGEPMPSGADVLIIIGQDYHK